MQVKPIAREEKWFPIPNDPDGGEILIREVSESDMMGYTISTLSFGSGDEATVGFLKKFYAGHIAGWRKLTGEDGEALPVTYANKLLLMEQPVTLDAKQAKELGFKSKGAKTNLMVMLEKWINEVKGEGQKKRELAEKN